MSKIQLITNSLQLISEKSFEKFNFLDKLRSLKNDIFSKKDKKEKFQVKLSTFVSIHKKILLHTLSKF